MNPIIFAIPVFFAMIGIELLMARQQGRTTYHLHDAVTSLNLGVMSQIVGVFSKAANIGIYTLIVSQVDSFSYDLKSPFVWVMALVLYDFCYYWQHRLGHEVNLLWAAHQVHHSSEDYNLSTALRQTSTGFLLSWIFYVPMALLEIPVLVFVIVGLIDLLYQFWVHTEVVRKLGWFDRVFISPSNHRVHHGQNPYCIDKNYGGIWIIWDRLFGTYAEERDDEPVVYGVLKPLQSWNPITANLQGYVSIANNVRSTPGLSNKLMRIFGPPGWQPAGVPAYPEYDAATFTRYETPFSFWQGVYGVVGFAVVAAFVIHFLMVAPELVPWQSAAYALLMVVSMLGLSAVFSGAPWAVVFEAARGALAFGALAGGLWFTPVSSLVQVIALLALLASLAILWHARMERSTAIRA